jgi:dolichyl-phosphate-mannose--protein O-mannosyl transferase
VGSRAGWVVYLVLLLAWVVMGLGRRLRTDTEADPEVREGHHRALVLFVVGWAVVLMAIAIAWRLFHPA